MKKLSMLMNWLGGIVLILVIIFTGCTKENPVGVQSDSFLENEVTDFNTEVQTQCNNGGCQKRPQLVAYYPFRGNARDRSCSGNHGEVFGATLTEDRFGCLNSAYDFDGDDDYIEANDTKNLQLSSWTLAGWIKLRDSFNQEGIIVWKVENEEEKYNFAALVSLIDVPQVSSQYETCDDDFDHSVFSEEIPKEVWTFFASTRDEESGEVRTYVNGQLQGSDDGGPDDPWKEHIPCMNSNQLRIGSRDGFSQGFNGVIDDIRIYNGVLSAKEIQMLYKNTKPYCWISSR